MSSTSDAFKAAVDREDHVAVSHMLCSKLNIPSDELLPLMRGILLEQIQKEAGYSQPAGCDDARVDDSILDHFLGEHVAEEDSGFKTANSGSFLEPCTPSTCTGAKSSRSLGTFSHSADSLCTDDISEVQEADDDVSTAIGWPSESSFEHFQGSFVHAAFGADRVSIEATFHSRTAGCWTAEDQTDVIDIAWHGVSVYMSERSGATQFDGKLDPHSGCISGEVVQDGIRGGSFELRPIPCDETHFVGRGPSSSSKSAPKVSLDADVLADKLKGCGVWEERSLVTSERELPLLIARMLANGEFNRGEACLPDEMDGISSSTNDDVSACVSRGGLRAKWSSRLRPLRSRPVRIGNAKELVVMALRPDGSENFIASLPKQGLSTIGDVKEALVQKFGREETADVRLGMRNDNDLVPHLDTDKLRTARVLATGFSSL